MEVESSTKEVLGKSLVVPRDADLFCVVELERGGAPAVAVGRSGQGADVRYERTDAVGPGDGDSGAWLLVGLVVVAGVVVGRGRRTERR